MNEDDIEKIRVFIEEADENGTHHGGMSYEDGMRDLLEVIEGNATVDELLG